MQLGSRKPYVHSHRPLEADQRDELPHSDREHSSSNARP